MDSTRFPDICCSLIALQEGFWLHTTTILSSDKKYSRLSKGQTEGDLEVPIGNTVSRKITIRLYINSKLIASDESGTGTILREIIPYRYTAENSTKPPPGGSEFLFKPSSKYYVRIEYQVHPDWYKSSTAGIYLRVQLFWNLIDRKDSIGQAKRVVSDADLIVLAVGAAWNSDSENSNHTTLGLSTGQKKLIQAIFVLEKPVVLVLEGGRPFAILEFYTQSAAVLSTMDILVGEFNPGGRVIISVPYDVGSLPAYYNQRTTKPTSHIPYYLDIPKPVLVWLRLPLRFSVQNPIQLRLEYSFGYGLSYTTFSQDLQSAKSSFKDRKEDRKKDTFSQGDTIAFSVSVHNTGAVKGSHVPQIYLLRRQGLSVTTPDKQLVAFTRLYINTGETATVTLELDIDRYLPVINRSYERVLEIGQYIFALMDDRSLDTPTIADITLS
ncbi:unnamed protein product, partial [Clonostachys rhizophaga]